MDYRELGLLLLFFASPLCAEGPLFKHKDSYANREFQNIYNDLRNPRFNTATGSSATLTWASISTATVGQLNASTGTIPSFMVTGTTTNDDAPIGRFGQYISSAAVASKAAPTTNQWGDFLSLSIPAGDWDVSTVGCWAFTDSVNTQFRTGISPNSGNNSTGLSVENGNLIADRETVVNNDSICQTIPVYRISIAATTTYYFKYLAVYPAGVPTINGIIHARRVR